VEAEIMSETNFEIQSFSEKDTLAAGREFSESLEPGDIVALFGDLGAGKTKLVQGICSGFGVGEPVPSPTFTIINLHTGSRKEKKVLMFHIDCYRLSNTEEAVQAGIEDCFRDDGIVLIEWPEICLPLFNEPYWRIDMGRGDQENIRYMHIRKLSGGNDHPRN
jgi:tRNA threonylcarbamoyladenosine biosynthesis protein TsaE